MQLRHRIVYLVFTVLLCSCRARLPDSTLSDDPSDWDPEKEIPELVHLGDVSPEERRLGEAFRASLVEVLRYWKAAGLKDPTDLDGLYNIGTFDDEKVVEVLEQLNPRLDDITAHVNAQYTFYTNSELFFGLRRLDKLLRDKGLLKDVKRPLPDLAFEKWAEVRYGFSTPDFHSVVMEGKTFDELPEEAETLLTGRDNAFFGQFPRIDLTDILHPANDQDPNRSIDYSRLLKSAAFAELADDKSLRIVILPRTTEDLTDTEVSTLRDLSVGAHELGHHLNHFLVRAENGKSLHRMVDEVCADFVAAAAADDPLVGKGFARASGIIADRLTAQNPEQRQLIEAYYKLSDQGFLRNMAEVESIDEMKRVWQIPNDYEGGNPLRAYLWQIRNDPSVSAQELDRLLLESIGTFSRLPSLITTKEKVNLWWRGMLLKGAKWLKTHQLILGLRNELTEEQLQAIQTLAVEETQKRVLEDKKLLNEFKDLSDDEQTALLKKMVGARVKALKKIYREEADAANRPEALRQLNAEIEADEARLRSKRTRRGWIRSPKRAVTTSDYVIPEFIRQLFRTANKNGYSPALISALQAYAEQTMNSSSMVIDIEGDKELVFFRRDISRHNPAAVLRIRWALQNMKSARRGLTELGGEEAADKSKAGRLNRQYAYNLEHIQEFQRTGSTFKLFFPHPILRPADYAGRATLAAIKAAAKLLPKKDDKRPPKGEAQEDPSSPAERTSFTGDACIDASDRID